MSPGGRAQNRSPTWLTYGQAMIDLSDLVLADPEGEAVRLGDLIERPTVIDVVRYFG